MKKTLLALSLLISIAVFSQENTAYISKLNNHRAEANKEFGDTATSILPDKVVLEEFKHLNYFEPNPKFNVTAKFKKELGKEFNMTTSSGKLKKYRQYGILSFDIDGKNYKLPIYQSIRLMKMEKYKDHVFIPFTDLTNDEETYGGGRYIEANLPTEDTFNLDFNYSFNPYCHYTTGYNCPIPPKENFLDLRIEAGEKKFKDDEH